MVYCKINSYITQTYNIYSKLVVLNMNKNVIVVTNEDYIADKYFTDLYKDKFIRVEEDLDVISGAEYVAKWENLINNTYHVSGIQTGESKLFRVHMVPFAGFAYMVAYNRKIESDDINLVVSINEAIPTAAVSLNLYHIFINSYTKVRSDVFIDYFDSTSTNSLLGSRFDIVIDMIKSNQIPLQSPGIYDLI